MPRCRSMSPSVFPSSDPLQCTRPESHNQTDLEVTHRSGARVWYGSKMPVQNSNLLAGLKGSFESMDRVEAEIELRDWWIGQAATEIEATVSKAIEYGSTDLIDIGLMLARTMRRTVNEQEAAELGVFFYLIGKIARWQSAIERGDRPSDDTLLDIGVYVRMAQRIRSAGGWPGISGGPANNQLGEPE